MLCKQDFSIKVGFFSSDQRHYSTYNASTFCPIIYIQCPAIVGIIHNCKASKNSSLRFNNYFDYRPVIRTLSQTLNTTFELTNEILLKQNVSET
jgi:hypothetical protein